MALKASPAQLQELQGTEGNRDFTLERCTENLTRTRPKTEAVTDRSLGQTYPASSCRGRGAVVAHPGDIGTGGEYIRSIDVHELS